MILNKEYIYIYIYRERERERESKTLLTCVLVALFPLIFKKHKAGIIIDWIKDTSIH